ncbi:MAG: HlyD family type I secretion periplasmic adaptor subunit [Alphaproteobacteria bacterium]|nr:HlyD family type I secretion periplasmic adaptor subunit [Alphaproteobacteria bacterium]
MAVALDTTSRRDILKSLESAASERRKSRVDPRRPVWIGVAVILTMFFGFGAWAAIADLARGVTAAGTLKIETERQVVDHLDGGIVSKVYIEEDQAVEKGDLLIQLDRTEIEANISTLRNRLDLALGQEARLVAELAGASAISFPDALLERADDPKVAGLMADQQDLFESREAELEGELEILAQRVVQLEKRIEGIVAQNDAQKEQYRLITEELNGLRQLLDKGHVSRTRVFALERQAAALEGQAGANEADISNSQVQIGEARMQAMQLKQRRRSEQLSRLQSSRESIEEIRQQLVVAHQRLGRTDVRAPHSGRIIDLAVHTEGSVVRPAQELMWIVPNDEEMLVEVQISPKDIETVRPGMPAEVKFIFAGGLKAQKRTPILHGSVISVSADIIEDERRGRRYYLAQVRVDEDQMKLVENHRVVPGMNAEVLFKVGERTALRFFVDPVIDTFEDGFQAP